VLTPQDLPQAFRRNLEIIRKQADGLTHADALLQPPFRGNCLNWVLGHILDSRDSVLEVLGEEKLLSQTEAKRYGYGSEPVCGDGPDVLSLDKLLADLGLSQARIDAALSRVEPDELAREVEAPWGKMTVAQHVFFFLWHETYHTGQTEPLRQLAGKNDKVI